MRLLKLFRLSSRKIIPILGHGNIFYHMVYIDDLTDAFLLAADHPDAVGQSFIIGGNECLTLNQIIDLISSNNQIRPIKIHLPALPFQLLGNIFERILIPVGISPPIYRRRVDFFTKSRSFNIHKSKQILGFQPKFPIEKGLMLTRKWYLDQKLL